MRGDYVHDMWYLKYFGILINLFVNNATNSSADRDHKKLYLKISRKRNTTRK